MGWGARNPLLSLVERLGPRGVHRTKHVRVYVSAQGLRIRGTHLKSSIQDIVDEVAPIKKASLWG